MQTTKLVFIVMIGLAMLEFSLAQSLTAAPSTKAAKPSLTRSKSIAPPATTAAKSTKSMQGLAAVYSDKLSGRKTASGQPFSQKQLTAAHRSLPLGTTVRVTNLRTSKSVEVRINDRGPRRAGHVIDLSAAAAAQVGLKKTGNALVMLEVVSEPSTSKS